MAITPGDALKTAVQPIPLGPLFDPQSGRLTLTGTGFFDANRLQAGEILSGVNRNRANIVQLETDYTAAAGAISAAYISADAVVAADATNARAALYTTITSEYTSVTDAISGTVTTNSANITTLQSTTASNSGAISTVQSEITAARDGEASLTAKISSVETAFASADSAIASDVSTLEATVTTIGSDLDTAEAAIVTNAAAITTEASARASGDSANATSVTNLTATVNGLGIGGNGCKDTEFRVITGYWATAASGGSASALTVETSTAGLRKLRATGTGMSSTSHYVRVYGDASNRLAVQAGDLVGVRAHVGAFNETKVQLIIVWRDSSGTYLSQDTYDSATGIVGGATELDTFANLSKVGTAPASAATAEIDIRAFWETGNVGLRVVNPVIAKLASGQTAPPQYSAGAAMEAHVQRLSEAYATDSSSTARLVWTVNTSTNAATIEQTAAEGYTDGTWNGSAISLTADEITLDGDVIVTGSLTTTQIAANAVTNTEGVSTDGSITLTPHTWVTVQSRAITTTGGDILVAYNAVPYVTTTTSISPIVQARVLRGATTVRAIHTTHFPSTNSDGSQQVGGAYSGFLIDSPSAATYTYYLQLKGTTASGSGSLFSSTAEFRSLYLTEFKR